jgi:hypothetical protein
LTTEVFDFGEEFATDRRRAFSRFTPKGGGRTVRPRLQTHASTDFEGWLFLHWRVRLRNLCCIGRCGHISTQLSRFGLRRMRRDSDDVTALDSIGVPKSVCKDPQWRAVMSEIITVGLDPAKNGFVAFRLFDPGACGRCPKAGGIESGVIWGLIARWRPRESGEPLARGSPFFAGMTGGRSLPKAIGGPADPAQSGVCRAEVLPSDLSLLRERTSASELRTRQHITICRLSRGGSRRGTAGAG